MNNIVILILSGMLAFFALILGAIIIYQMNRQAVAALQSAVGEAEKDLISDINRIGIIKLQQTGAGRELLAIYMPENQKAATSTFLQKDYWTTDYVKPASPLLRLKESRAIGKVSNVRVQEQVYTAPSLNVQELSDHRQVLVSESKLTLQN